MNYELEEMIENGATADEIGEYMWLNCRKKLVSKKYFVVNGKRLYPIMSGNAIIGWEWD